MKYNKTLLRVLITILPFSVFGSVFVSKTTPGNWSSMGAWATQDGGAVSRVPTSGDTVTISGIITVDTAVTVGSGSGEAVTISASANIGDKKLIVAAPLTVKGSIFNNAKSVISVSAGAGIELDGNAGVTPKIHGPSGSGIHLYFNGTPSNRCYLRTKAGSAGAKGTVLNDAYHGACNVAGSYVDITDIGDTNVWGITFVPTAEATSRTLDHAVFTRCALNFDVKTAEFTLSNAVFNSSPVVAVGDMSFSCYFVSSHLLNIVNCGFDAFVWINQLKNITGNVFLGRFYFYAYAAENFKLWSDNLVFVTEPSSGFIITKPGTYNRSYWICANYAVSNPHILGAGGTTTFDQCIWDVPFANDVDDALLLRGESDDLEPRRRVP